MVESQSHLFCFGLGYSALTIARSLLDDGWRVSGTCRSQEKCDSLRSDGITAQVFDSDMPLQNILALDTVTHLLVSIPPNDSGDLVLEQHMTDLQNLSDLSWCGYFSTTGVYGDHQGGWVDEEAEKKATNQRSQNRIIAEQQWLDSGLPVEIFRLSGIYGARRSIFDSLKKGTARRIDKPGQVFSRIHVDDIGKIVQAAIKAPCPGVIYNCADHEPAPQADVVLYAATLLGIEPPPIVPFEKAQLSEMARSFYSSNRRVANDKIIHDLQVELLYPTYREGLQAIYDHSNN